MNIPHQELLAPGPPVDSVAAIGENATVATIFGKAKDLGDLLRRIRVEMLWISGVSDAAANVVGRMRSIRRLVIHGLRASDLKPFTEMSALEELSIAGSSRLKSLAGLESLARLKSLILFDCCNYGDVAAVASLTVLETLCLEGGFSKQLSIDSLEPLGSLTGLRRLRLASIRVKDRSLRPLHSLTGLRDVFIAKMFPPAELRSLSEALPNARGEYLDSMRGVD